MRRALVITFALVGLLAMTGTAAADCAEGRIITEQTAGRCCWPGQTWNEAGARCEGAPNCPGGWGAEGDTCVRDAVPAPPSVHLQAPVASVAPPSRGPVLSERTEPLIGLAIAGGITLGVGYLYSIITGSIFLANSGSCGGYNSWVMYIPVIGGFIWPAIDDSCGYSSSLGDIFGIPGAGVQVIGLTLLLIGLLVQRRVQVWESPDDGPRLSAGPGELGLAVNWLW